MSARVTRPPGGAGIFKERGAPTKYPLDNADDFIDALPALEILNGLSIRAQRWRGGYRQGRRSWRPTWWA